MANVMDVAKFILEQTGEISAMKLQKLVYYSQAWSIVWEEELLFNNRIEAWANGPVSPELYAAHRKQFTVSPEGFSFGDSDNLNDVQKENVRNVLDYYSNWTAQQLSDLTHSEAPWIDARGSCGPTERCSNEILPASMHMYYSGL